MNSYNKKVVENIFTRVFVLVLAWSNLLFPVTRQDCPMERGLSMLTQVPLLENSLSFLFIGIFLIAGSLLSLFSLLQIENIMSEILFDIAIVLFTVQGILYFIFAYYQGNVAEWIVIAFSAAGLIIFFILHLIDKIVTKKLRN